jgi:hypothetical protein
MKPREALAQSRVDLIAVIDKGIAPREYVPGAKEVIPKGKRIHVAAEKKTGKSVVFATLLPVQIVAAGGKVVVLDRENGADESARRLETVLDARGADDSFRETVQERLRYHAWPQLRLEWANDPDYPQAFGDADVVVFDSSRSHTASLALRENESDDYSAFVARLIDPLMRAGKAVIVLDNTGHLEKERARGTTAKEDLCDVAFTLTKIKAFTTSEAGRLELRCVASRLGEVGGTWQMELGGGHYGTWQRLGPRPPEAREALREAVVEVLLAGETMGSNRIAKAIRARPGNTLRFDDKDLHKALKVWGADPASGVLADPAGKGFTADGEPFHHGGHGESPPPWGTTGDGEVAESRMNIGDEAMVKAPTTAHHGGHGACVPPYRGTTPTMGADGSASAEGSVTPLEPVPASDDGHLAEEILRRREGRR